MAGVTGSDSRALHFKVVKNKIANKKCQMSLMYKYVQKTSH